MNENFVGRLLVASTLVDDPVFSKAVGLVVHQDDDNVVGVLLNRPMQPVPTVELNEFAGPSISRRDQTEITLAEAAMTLGKVHFGGPLSGPVVAVHGCSQHAEAETGSGVFVAAEKQHLEAIVRDRPSAFRLIVGHVGWDISDLQTQIEAGYWHVMPASSDSVLDCHDDEMWPLLVRRATAGSVAGWLGVPDVPAAHAMN